MGQDLITLAEYKAYVGITSTNQDAQIKSIIPKASSFIKNYCRRTFIDYVNDAKTEIFNGGKFILLAEYPVLQISSVEYSADYGKTYTPLVEYVDYALDMDDGTIVPIQTTDFARITNGYKVTYTAGFEEIPEDLKLAALDLVTYQLKQEFSVKSQRDAGSNTVQIEYITRNSLPSHIARVLDLYLGNVN